MPHVEVPDIPRSDGLRLPADRTAVITVDMQNDFVAEGGALHVPSANGTLPVIRDVMDRARRAGARVAYTQDWHEQDDPEFRVWPRHAVRGSKGAEIVPELTPKPQEPVMQKPRYDGFYGTPLDHQLRVWGVQHVVVMGTVANICVQHTAASAALRWYDVALVEDGISALSDFDLHATLRQLTFLYLGQVVRAADLRFEPRGT